jgi:CRP-like cAMP-binding protein
MPIDIFKDRLGSESFARLMQNNVGAALYCTQQYLACNAKHPALARCARWLLMTADRAGRTAFTLNQTFLGIMLSVHEGEMQRVIGELTGQGAISYSKADLSIIDADLLRRLSCECYAACKSAFVKSLAAA